MNFFKKIDDTSIKNNDNLIKKYREKMINKLIKDEKEERKKNKKSGGIYKKGDDLWRVGVICKNDIYELTEQILKILDNNGYEWRLLETSYNFKIRKKKSSRSKVEKNSNLKLNPLNIGLKIYSGVENSILDEYLIDLKKFCGPVMEFLEFSRELISSLQMAGLVLYKVE